MEPVAERLYYGSEAGMVGALDFEATVTDIRLAWSGRNAAGELEQIWQVALDRTAFYPEGGGQPCDTGVLIATARSGAVLDVPVERVEEDDAGEVWHSVRKPLVTGTTVTGEVDAARRVDHEQQHSGQHLLSAMFLREAGARTVSFHLGAESSTIDLQLREGMERLSPEDLQRVEAAANRVVCEGRPLLAHWVQPEFAEAMLARGDLQKIPEREGPLRVVQMQGIEFNACGGTHVSNTGAIGAVTIRRVEKVKAGWRVEFCCGNRAVRAAREDFLRLSEMAGALSVGAAEAPSRLAALLEEIKAGAKERKALLEELARMEATLLVQGAASGAEAPSAAVQTVFAGRDVEFAKRVASHAAALGRTAVVGVTQGADGAVALARASGSGVVLDCGALLREVAATVGARGGGAADRAQGVCRADQVAGLVAALAARMNG